MSSYFSSVGKMFSKKASATDTVKDSRTFEEKAAEASKEDFVFMDESVNCPDLTDVKSNDDVLKTPSGQMFNAQGEFINGLKHASYAAGNVVLAGGYGVAAAANLHNAFAVVSHVGSALNEAKVTLGLAVDAEKLIQKGKDAYDYVVGNPIEVHAPTNLDHAYDFVKKADNVFHENTDYLAMRLNALKTYFYPENLVGLFSNSKKAITNTYQAIKSKVNTTVALAKAGYYKAAEVISNAFDNSSEAAEPKSFAAKYSEWLAHKGSFSDQETLIIKNSPLLEGMLDEIDLSGNSVIEGTIID